MGIDLHNLNFLAHAKRNGVRFERTLAIGRQSISIDDWELEAYRHFHRLPHLDRKSGSVDPSAGRSAYFEPLLKEWFGACTTDSVDASPYEGATLIHDMNESWAKEGKVRQLQGSYDAVLDFGCLEHVFDFPTAWRNCVDMCRVGGHILHALPANNLSGHGFYQFSPELFFNLYKPQRGFEVRELVFAIKDDVLHWWRVADPMGVKRRVNLRNSHEVYMLVLARKTRETTVLSPPQQSDYEQSAWLASSPDSLRQARLGLRQSVVRQLGRSGLVHVARRVRARCRAILESGISLPAPDYQRVVIRDLLGRSMPR